MSGRIREAVVVGGGVSGLSAGVRLREAGLPVTLVAAEMATDPVRPKGAGEWPPSPCSPWAAAIWYPYRAEPRDLVDRWAVETLHALRRIAAAEPEAGVWEAELLELFVAGQPVPEEGWHLPVGVERVTEGLPEGFAAALRMRVPFIDTPVYLPWLLRRFEGLGGRVERRVVRDLAAEAAPGRAVVNCTGLGARRLSADDAVYPCRGQVLRVERPAAAPYVVHDAPGGAVTYVFPRGADCILGGTAEDDAWDEAADPATLEAIRRGCEALVPAVAGARILGQGAGLRPARRGSVRLEAERVRGGGLLVHDYGHGGAGYTLSWGCADEVVRRVAAASG